MQRVGAQYIVKKVTDQILAPAPSQTASVGEVQSTAPSLDGQMIRDEEGNALGPAKLLPGLSVYVVSRTGRDIEGDLRRAVQEPEAKVFFHTEGNRITGIIYVPNPGQPPAGLSGARADDV